MSSSPQSSQKAKKTKLTNSIRKRARALQWPSRQLQLYSDRAGLSALSSLHELISTGLPAYSLRDRQTFLACYDRVRVSM